MTIGGQVELPGHEKTFGPLQKIASAYKEASTTDGVYKFDQKVHDEAVKAIMGLSQFYTKDNARQILARAVSDLPLSKPAVKKPVVVVHSSVSPQSQSRPRAADDVATIHSRIEELRREQAAARNNTTPPASLNASPAGQSLAKHPDLHQRQLSRGVRIWSSTAGLG